MKLKEAKVLSRPQVFFVKAWDPEEGDISTYAGPFHSKNDAENFAEKMAQLDQQKYAGLIDYDFPEYYVETLLGPEEFRQEIEKHLDEFAG